MHYGQRQLRFTWPILIFLWVALVGVTVLTLWMLHAFQYDAHLMDTAMGSSNPLLIMRAEYSEHHLLDVVGNATLFFVFLALAFGLLVSILVHKLFAILTRLSTVLDGTVVALANAIEVRDENTGRHSEAIGNYAQQLGLAMGLDPEQAHQVRLGAILHDIGKIGIPDAILSKPGRLTTVELDIMRRHPLIGANIMSGLDGLQELVPLILHHQERFDGRGYPDGLQGEEIPLGARIIAVVDAFQAMTADRPYRRALPQEEAIQELIRNAGTQFDPAVVTSFLRLIGFSPSLASLPAS